MKIESGKRYRLKTGEVVGPVSWDEKLKVWRRNSGPCWVAGDYWHANGLWHGYTTSDKDIVAEVE